MGSADHGPTTDFDEIRRRIDEWRATRPHRNVPMPAALWAAAVAAAREHGLLVAARGLRVDYGALKNHVHAADEASRVAERPTFIEMPALPAFDGPGPVTCVIEIDVASGTRRIQLQGLAPGDLLTLARMAWSAAQ